MSRDVFLGLKYIVINSLISEYQISKDISYRSDLIDIINLINIFLDFDNFIDRYNSFEQFDFKSDNFYKIRSIVVSSLYNVQMESVEKDILLIELTKFFSKCMDIKQLTKVKKNIKISL